MKKQLTLWDRLRADVKEQLIWETRRYPNLHRDVIPNLLNTTFLVDLPFGTAMDVYLISGCDRIGEIFNLFKTNLGS